MDLKNELDSILRASVPLLHVVSYEEERVLRALLDVRAAHSLGVTSWDVADGFVSHRQGAEAFPPKDCTSDTLLPYVAQKLPRGHILILKDFHHAWTRSRGVVTRKLRNLVPQLRAQSQFIIILTPPLDPPLALPSELKDDVVVLDVPLPGAAELEQLFSEMTAKLDPNVLPRPALRDKLIQSALGLSTNQARLALSRAFARFEKFDERAIDVITAGKRAVIRESGALEFWPAGHSEADVGGLDLLKTWLKKRGAAFFSDARAAGLPFPRGVALIGIPGTGKSLSAKMLSGLWKLPLLRLDVGTLFGSLLGESEQNMRKAIGLAETVSPCILWIDEMEKAFAGSEAGALNSGAATRVFGTFLTWMQEHQSPVFVLATANDIGRLPAELMGRFDRTFFLDLPADTERRAIFLIHLKNAGVAFPERELDLRGLIDASRGYVGREIERAVREAQFTAFADGNRTLEQADLLQALQETVPLSQSHSEIIEALRKWKTEGRAFPASGEEERRSNVGRVLETM